MASAAKAAGTKKGAVRVPRSRNPAQEIPKNPPPDAPAVGGAGTFPPPDPTPHPPPHRAGAPPRRGAAGSDRQAF